MQTLKSFVKKRTRARQTNCVHLHGVKQQRQRRGCNRRRGSCRSRVTYPPQHPHSLHPTFTSQPRIPFVAGVLAINLSECRGIWYEPSQNEAQRHSAPASELTATECDLPRKHTSASAPLRPPVPRRAPPPCPGDALRLARGLRLQHKCQFLITCTYFNQHSNNRML